jgi:hypothetical protein
MGLLAALVFILPPALSAQEVTVEDAWIRAAPPNAMAMAGYMNISNQTDSDVAVVGVTSDAFASAMIHETVIEDGIAKMHHHKRLVIPRGQSVSLEPNGYHLMLMRPKKELEPGDQAELTLELDTGTKISVAMPVRTMAAD